MHLRKQVSRESQRAVKNRLMISCRVDNRDKRGPWMSVLELSLMQLPVKWIRLKIYDEKNIAIGCFVPKKSESIQEKKRPITVIAFTYGVGMYGDEISTPLPGTERKFRKSEKKIAQWYFRELCSSLKNGLLLETRDERKPLGKWD